MAVIHDQLEALSCLLDVVQTVDCNKKIINSVNKQQQTALHIAVLTDNVEAVIVSNCYFVNSYVVLLFGIKYCACNYYYYLGMIFYLSAQSCWL